MKLPLISIKKWNYLALAFLFPFAGMLFVMLFSQYEPFGSYSMLYSDMYHQYYPFFVQFRKALLSGDSLLYTWSVGMGMDYLGLIAYYLASPLNLLSVLVPERFLLEFFSLLVPIKLGLAGLFFGLFLKKTTGRDDLSLALFGSFYALSAWALGYQWNIMWLDTFALLPLVVLGMILLLREQKFILYTVSLFLSICANYYIGLFVCIFVFLLFFCYEFCRWGGWKKFFLDLCRIAFFSFLAIGMTAFLELPAFAALQTTQSSVNNFPHGFKLNIATENTVNGLFDAMRQVAGNLGGGLVPTFKEGLPNLYCGVGTVVLAWCYLLHRKVPLRDKVCCVLLLLFFMLSFILRQLDYIWHGFHFTNMIPYRFSFLYSFVLLYMAYQAWMKIRGIRTWQMVLAVILTLGIFACSDSRMEWAFLTYNLVALCAYAVIGIVDSRPFVLPEDVEEEELPHYRFVLKRRRRIAATALAVVMALELTANLVNFGIRFPGTGVSNYPKGTTYAASMIRYMKEREQDNLFYRAETTHSQTLNDGALNSYNGISTFTSSANVRTTEFMKALGYGAKNTYNRYCFEESSPVANLFLGLKYMLERDGKDKQSTYFREIHRYGSVALLENQAYLPLGFLTEQSLAELDFSVSEGFRLQNNLLSAASGIDSDVWRVLTGDSVDIYGIDVSITDQNSSGYCSYSDGLTGSNVVYSYSIDSEGFLCVDLNLPKRNNIAIWKNGTELYTESMSLPQMLAVGDVVPGDLVEVRVTCGAGESGTMTITSAILNRERFMRHYEVLAASQLELTEFSNTKVTGTIDCNRDGLLYTSIPQDGNWTVLVDGQPRDIQLVGDVMCAVPLTEGSHEVTFVYQNSAFTAGWMISLLCAVCFAVICYWNLQPKSVGKYEEKKRKD